MIDLSIFLPSNFLMMTIIVDNVAQFLSLTTTKLLRKYIGLQS